MSTDEKDGYTVGYGKPPVHGRFKKGQSGNPRGRTRRAKDFATLLLEALDKRIAVNEGGRRRRITKRELGLAHLADRFAKADPCVSKLLIGLLLELERRPPAEPAARPARDAADALVVEDVVARLRAT